MEESRQYSFLQLIWSLVTRDGAEDAHLGVRVPYPRALCYLYKPNFFLQPSLHRRRVSKVAYPVELMGSTMRSTSLVALLKQTKVSPVQASLGSKSTTALSKV